MINPGPMNYGKMIMTLAERINGLIGNYNHLKTEMDHMSLEMKELDDKLSILEEENKRLKDKVGELYGQTKSARKVRKGTK